MRYREKRARSESRCVVIDCCVTMAWLAADKKSQSGYANAVLDLFEDGAKAIVPALWNYEVSNVLSTLIKTTTISDANAYEFVKLLSKLPIQVVPDTSLEDVAPRVAVAKEHGLSAYDASYLALAVNHGCPLATVDKQLMKAAKQQGVYFERV